MITIAAVLVVLMTLLDTSKVEVQLDMVKIALAAGAGAGGLVTLLLAVRRQLLAEESADDGREDAAERRITDLYVRGVEQFGSPRPEVKIGGLYALERLAEAAPELREQVVDIVCAALKPAPGDRLPENVESMCLRFLIDHFAFESPFAHHKTFWRVNLVDLSRSILLSGPFDAARVNTMHFRDATFEGDADFESAAISGANFRGVTFEKAASFEDAKLGKGVFVRARFLGPASFVRATFQYSVSFSEAEFAVAPVMEGARVTASPDAEIILPPGWEAQPSADPEWLSIVAVQVTSSKDPRRGSWLRRAKNGKDQTSQPQHHHRHVREPAAAVYRHVG